jgi:hypothetical protein
MESPLSLLQVVGCVAIIILAFSLKNYYQSDESGFFASVAVVGLRPEWLNWLQSNFRSLWATQGWSFDGYNKVRYLRSGLRMFNELTIHSSQKTTFRLSSQALIVDHW